MEFDRDRLEARRKSIRSDRGQVQFLLKMAKQGPLPKGVRMEGEGLRAFLLSWIELEGLLESEALNEQDRLQGQAQARAEEQKLKENRRTLKGSLNMMQATRRKRSIIEVLTKSTRASQRALPPAGQTADDGQTAAGGDRLGSCCLPGMVACEQGPSAGSGAMGLAHLAGALGLSLATATGNCSCAEAQACPPQSGPASVGAASGGTQPGPATGEPAKRKVSVCSPFEMMAAKQSSSGVSLGARAASGDEVELSDDKSAEED
eukprot:4016023-Prymnesium_polylepis.1